MRKRRRSGSVILWVVGRMRNGGWEFCGVFDDEDKALDAVNGPEYFMAPATLNSAMPDETTEWPGLRFPLLESPGLEN